MKQISLRKIINIAMEAVASFGNKESVTRFYRQTYNRLIQYFSARNRTIFSVQLADDFVKECKQQLEKGICSICRFKYTRRAAQLLKDYYYTGNIVWKPYSFAKKRIAPTNPVFVKLQEDYIGYLVELGWKRNSIESADNHSRQFLVFIEAKERRSIAEIEPIDVSEFFPQLIGRYQATSIGTVASTLRSFITYIGKAGITQAEPLLRAIPTRCARKRSIIPAITKEEGEAILSAQQADESCSQRNRAIILLALRTGLRSVDVINLKFSDIDWRNDTISIVQQKTGQPLVLPLVPEVGNAIAAYIMQERPESDLPYIFLRSRAPYKQLTSNTSCWWVSANAMRSACVRQEKGDRKGLHVFRHSLATNLLAEGVAVPVIASILGHSNKESTNIYLSADEVHLKECALGLSGIEVTREELL
ncbi:MAG: tyrosine-type recombinase/integrase [Candidatus Bathyarchaeota archaeon]|nr:tyrosine-type recombinase/integrase [Candidatus Bathyarchaeota archaeon]